MPQRRWVWEPFSPDTTSLSGDIGKLFRNDPVKAPGVLEREAPTPNAAVMAREVIQNSWDAAGEARRLSPPPPEFAIEFAFHSALGDEKLSLARALGLDALADRLRACGRGEERAKLGLREHTCLDSLDDARSPLSYLVITETGTTGMYGAWATGKSRMYLALAALGYTPKPDGGGSYGYGKAGMIRGSATHSIVAYTCFRDGSAEDGVTRRLLGMTYWGQHTLNSESYPGFARFGCETDEERVVPFENEEADEVARSLGLALRDPSSGSDFGTTFLVVEPTVDPDHLMRAIERYWWPPLEDSSIPFNISIRTEQGQRHPRPKKDPVLRTFIEAYELATVPQDNTHPHKRSTRLTAIKGTPAGTLGMTADLSGWSYPQQTEVDAPHRVEHRSLIALMREPRMVVEYYVAGQTAPFVRGVFVADQALDGDLRKTEPKGHDAWQTKPDEDGDAAAAKIAETVLNRIKSNVATFRLSLKPPKPPQEQLRLPEFDKLMRQLLRGDGPSAPPPAGPRDVSIRLDPILEDINGEQIRAVGHAKFGLSEEFTGEAATVQVRLRYVLVEDDRAGDAVPLEIQPPAGFARTHDSDHYVGQILRDSPAEFTFQSAPHDALWTGRMIAEADVVQDDPP